MAAPSFTDGGTVVEKKKILPLKCINQFFPPPPMPSLFWSKYFQSLLVEVEKCPVHFVEMPLIDKPIGIPAVLIFNFFCAK